MSKTLVSRKILGAQVGNVLVAEIANLAEDEEIGAKIASEVLSASDTEGINVILSKNFGDEIKLID